MANPEPVRSEALLDPHVVARQELAEDFDGQDADRQVAEHDRSQGDVGRLGDRGQHVGSALPQPVAPQGSRQLPPGRAPDAGDQRLGPHDLEDVADVGQQDREVDDRQRQRRVHAPGGHEIGLELGPDQEGVEDRDQRQAQHQRVPDVAREEADDPRRVARGGHLDAEDDSHQDDAERHAFGASGKPQRAGGRGGIRGHQLANRVDAADIQRAEKDGEHHRHGDQRDTRQGGPDPALPGADAETLGDQAANLTFASRTEALCRPDRKHRRAVCF